MPHLPSDVTEEAVCYSLTQLDINSRALYGNEAFAFLPTMITESGPQSYLHAAMRAVGVINFANRSPTMDMKSVVDSEYAKAISGVTAALTDPVLCLRDETLVSVWLLGIWEVSILLAMTSVTDQSDLISASLQREWGKSREFEWRLYAPNTH